MHCDRNMLRGSEVANSFNQHCNQSPPISEILLKRSELDAVKKVAGITVAQQPQPHQEIQFNLLRKVELMFSY